MHVQHDYAPGNLGLVLRRRQVARVRAVLVNPILDVPRPMCLHHLENHD